MHLLAEAYKTMIKEDIHCLFVTDQDRLNDIISAIDILTKIVQCPYRLGKNENA